MNSQSKPTIVWLRLDLRLEDHPAFRAAKERGGPILPVFIWAPEEETPWAPGAASRWWLHHSLERLDEQLREQGSRLILRRGPSLGSLLALVKETGADAIYWNRRYEPAVIKRDKAIKNVLTESVREVASFNSALLLEPWTVENKSGRPFQVFTPFWKTCLSLIDVPAPLPALRKPEAPRALAKIPRSERTRAQTQDPMGLRSPGNVATRNRRSEIRTPPFSRFSNRCVRRTAQLPG